MSNPIQPIHNPAAPAPRARRNGRAHRNWRARRGGSVLEAALVMPLLVLITLPMIEFAQLFFVKHTFASASRDGARKAILKAVTHDEATNAVRVTMRAAGIADTKYTLTFKNAATDATITNVGTAAAGTGIKVVVSANYGAVGYPQWFLSGNRVVTGTSAMIKE